MRQVLVIILFITLTGKVSGQLSTIQQQLVWLGATVELELPNNFALGLHAEERRFAFPDGRQQRVVADLYLQKQLNNKWEINAGLWLFEIAVPQDPLATLQGHVKETRLYLALNRYRSFTRSRLRFRLQSEYRHFRTIEAPSFFEGPILSQRIRERLLFEYSISLSPKNKLLVYEELHLTIGLSEKRELFQQNRLGATYQRTWGENFTTELGYIFWFQPTGLPNEYFARQIASLRLKYTFKWK